MRDKRLLPLLTVMLVLIYSKAYAHRVYFFAYAESGKVIAEGYYIDGKKAVNSNVEVFDKDTGAKLLEGKTNNKGQFSFTPPKGKNLNLTINAGMGHKSEFSLMATQLGTTSTPVSTVKKQDNVKNVTTKLSPAPVNMAELKKIVDSSLDEKLRPIIIGIEKSANNTTSFQSIVGGIGYIFGLMGVAMYFSGKNKS